MWSSWLVNHHKYYRLTLNDKKINKRAICGIYGFWNSVQLRDRLKDILHKITQLEKWIQVNCCYTENEIDTFGKILFLG